MTVQSASQVTDKVTGLNSIIRKIPKFNEYVIGLSIIFYVSGFLIANIFLGSLGATSFDVVRIRYLLIGILFAGFLASFLIPLYGLFNLLVKNIDKPIYILAVKALVFSFDAYIIILFLTFTIPIFAGAIGFPVGIPHLSEPHQISEWVQTILPGLFTQLFGFLKYLFLPVYGLVVIAGCIIFVLSRQTREDGTYRSKIEKFKLYLSMTVNKDSLQIMIGTPIVYFVVIVVSSLISFTSTNSNKDVMSLYLLTGNVLALKASFRFFFGSILVYLLFAVMFFWGIITVIPEKDEIQSGRESRARMGAVYVICIAIVIIFPLYTVGIYPSLPQQIGGGAVIRVEIATTNKDLSSVITKGEVETYLIDRASNYSLLLVFNKLTNAHEVLQINNTEIQFISYGPFIEN